MPAHNRKEHPRTNPNKTLSHVKKAVVHTKGPQHKTPPPSQQPPANSPASLIEDDHTPQHQNPTTTEMRAALTFYIDKLYRNIHPPDDETDNELTEKETELLRSLKSILDELPLSDTKDTEADHIFFALEHPEWTSQGFNRNQAAQWKTLELTPEESKEWKDHGFTALEAIPWLQAASLWISTITPQDAATFRDAGITPEQATPWEDSGMTPEQATEWINAGITPEQATPWEDNGMTPTDYTNWTTLGVHNPADAWTLQQLGHTRTQTWLKAGANLEDIPQLTRFEPLKTHGHTEKDLLALHQAGIKHTTATKWLTHNIPAEQIPTFIQKGYTPKKAAKQLAKGNNATTAPNTTKPKNTH